MNHTSMLSLNILLTIAAANVDKISVIYNSVMISERTPRDNYKDYLSCGFKYNMSNIFQGSYIWPTYLL